MTEDITVGNLEPGERVMRQVRWGTGILDLEDGVGLPTPGQVACVMHALADYTHNQYMVGEALLQRLGKDRYPDPITGQDRYEQAVALGRYFHELGDRISPRFNRGKDSS